MYEGGRHQSKGMRRRRLPVVPNKSYVITTETPALELLYYLERSLEDGLTLRNSG